MITVTSLIFTHQTKIKRLEWMQVQNQQCRQASVRLRQVRLRWVNHTLYFGTENDELQSVLFNEHVSVIYVKGSIHTVNVYIGYEQRSLFYRTFNHSFLYIWNALIAEENAQFNQELNFVVFILVPKRFVFFFVIMKFVYSIRHVWMTDRYGEMFSFLG